MPKFKEFTAVKKPKSIKVEPTSRGFLSGKFEDRYGHACSIQESSIMADEGHIWLGLDNPDLKILKRGEGWRDINLRELFPTGDLLESSRMHLSQSDVKQLLPMLKYFAKHGRLPTDDN